MNIATPRTLEAIAPKWRKREFAACTVWTAPGWYVQLDSHGLARVEHTTKGGTVARVESPAGAGAAIRACLAAVEILKGAT